MLELPHVWESRASYARREEFRRLSRAGTALVGSAVAVLLALSVANVGQVSLAGVLIVVAVVFALSARHWLGLAERSRVGVRSEEEVLRALAPLRTEGWRLRHSLQWRGKGDIHSARSRHVAARSRSR